MDKSMDSIGSCSLDVDADSSDISDTSGSLNFPTPISIKDITKEFTANIHERCTVRKVHMQTIPNQPTTTSTAVSSTSALRQIHIAENEKKPSYLNLACCVNGYSNITTYDSKIRQDINKSREVSPIRPSSSSIQYCKKNDCLAPPSLQKTPNPNPSMNGSNVKKPTANSSKFTTYRQENGNGNGHQTISGEHHHQHHHHHRNDGKQQQMSFIQQRVERLYGPGALAQGFYSQKKVKDSTAGRSSSFEHDHDLSTSELTLKFKQLSPSKDYGEFRRKINGTESQSQSQSSRSTLENNMDNNNIDLPVLRHLSQEFRAQLPKISPKRNVIRSPPSLEIVASTNLMNSSSSTKEVYAQKLAFTDEDEVDHKNIITLESIGSIDMMTSLQDAVIRNVVGSSIKDDNNMKTTIPADVPVPISNSSNTTEIPQPQAQPQVQNRGNLQQKDGNYFLKVLKNEQERLLALACVAEKWLEELTDQPEITEEMFGLLRSASGKARLLVSQKMKQFEGLCHKNLNDVPGQKFPTTNDDLQGFWDMVNLQVDHIDSIFAELEVIKKNNWKKIDEIPVESPKKSSRTNVRISSSKTTKVASNGNSIKPQASMSAAALKRESQRKQLMEMKRKNRMALAENVSQGGGGGDDVDHHHHDANNAIMGDATSGKKPLEIFINENQS